MSGRILAIDDDPVVLELVTEELTAAGFEVIARSDGQDAVEIVGNSGIDLAIVDVVLPGTNGIEIAKQIRQMPGVGIIILSAQDHLADRLVGLEVGADDYVVKPFETRELVARVRSVLRRIKDPSHARPKMEPSTEYQFLGWRLDPSAFRVARPDGSELPLTTGEFKVLEFLVTHPNRFWDAGQLAEQLTARGVPTAAATIMSCIKRIRKQLGENARQPQFIETLRGSGYKFLPKVTKTGTTS